MAFLKLMDISCKQRVNWFQKSEYKKSATENTKISGIIKTSYWKWAVAGKWDSGGEEATAAISTATAEIDGSGGGKGNRRQSGNNRSAHLFPPSFGLCIGLLLLVWIRFSLLCWDVVLPRQILLTPDKLGTYYKIHVLIISRTLLIEPSELIRICTPRADICIANKMGDRDRRWDSLSCCGPIFLQKKSQPCIDFY